MSPLCDEEPAAVESGRRRTSSDDGRLNREFRRRVRRAGNTMLHSLISKGIL
jgi:hypothetical protein